LEKQTRLNIGFIRRATTVNELDADQQDGSTNWGLELAKADHFLSINIKSL